MMNKLVDSDGSGLTKCQSWALVALQILIGWHFFYEGLAKLINPYWSSTGYLAEAEWWLGGMFRDLAASPTAVTVIDFMNMWGLTLIGLALFLGLLTRPALIAGMVLLFLYYIVAPPFPAYSYAMPAEGSYLVVNKVLIELAAMAVLFVFPTNKLFGLDRLIPWKGRAGYTAEPEGAVQ
jgi:thiosulfate dehydrogenase [quinone] large subunit